MTYWLGLMEKIMDIDHQYTETLEYMFAQLPMYQRVGQQAFKKDLTNIRILMKHLDDPHKDFPCIHIAGTNGKGTVSHIVAAILQAGGYRTGLYTSPHYRDFRERIKVDGQWIEKEAVVHFAKTIRSEIDVCKPSFFEISVAMAFNYFRHKKVDIAVIETGLGGRLDSTNIVDPLISVITNISMDHEDMLGNSLYQIAGEKAGIIKKERPVIIGRYQSETDTVFISKAKMENSHIMFASLEWQSTCHNSVYRFVHPGRNQAYEVERRMPAPFLDENTITSLETIHTLIDGGFIELQISDISEGINYFRKLTNYKGRWDVLGEKPLIIADSAHNKDAITKVLEWIGNMSCARIHFVLGFTSEKKPHELLKLFPVNADYYFVRANIPRAIPSKDLCESARTAGLNGSYFDTVKDGIKAARKSAGERDLIFIGGSSYVAAEALPEDV